MMNYVQTLTRYKAWADELFLDAVAELPDQQIVAPRPILFGSIVRTLNHSYAMDQVWKAHLLGIAHGFTSRNPESHPPFAELRVGQREIDAWFVNYANELRPEELTQVVDFTFIGGGDGSMTRGEILLHIVNHTTYHRGHVADMLYHLSKRPPTTDLPVFLRERARPPNSPIKQTPLRGST